MMRYTAIISLPPIASFEQRGSVHVYFAGPCPDLSTEPYVHYEVVKMGKNPNITFFHGTVVRVICARGYRLNIGTNNTAKCSRRRWKPQRPDCEIRKFFLLSNFDSIVGIFLRSCEFNW